MPQIILASKSLQRRKLLKKLGIKFKIKQSRVIEKRRIISSCANLVKENALNKAKSVAKSLKSGIVVAADTVVLVDKRKIIGKPKNLKEAKKILKTLSRKPHWVYTGLAAIDILKKKVLTDYDKSKVYMYPLTNKEINSYLKNLSVLDKSGAFDIQNQGSIFIRRIEGGFYNIVGLPLAKLYRMLKRLGVSLLGIIFAVYLCGCATEYNIATQKEEFIFYSTDKEINIGRSVAREFERQYKLVEDASLQERVDRIGEKIAAICDRKDVNYYFKVLDTDEINAVSLPGGFVYCFKGLTDKLSNDDELAFVLAHEVAHIVAKHSIKKMQAALGYSLMNLLLIPTTDADFVRGANAAFVSVMLEYSKEDEFLADKLGVKYMKEAGFNPEGAISFLRKLKDQKEIRPFSYWRTHPYISERIAVLKKEIYGQMEFIDYFNIE